MDFPGGSDSKESIFNAEDPGSIPGSGRAPGKENGNLPCHSGGKALQYSCLENFTNGGAQWATVHEVTRSQTQLSD